MRLGLMGAAMMAHPPHGTRVRQDASWEPHVSGGSREA